ncbi:Uncharacterised protein [Mycobacteroides abscessus subsp. abscessus]|jgi:hypothetical protein|nr:Uncharacterised protein [Mycobacteroides abscessus subsp. abscessus]
MDGVVMNRRASLAITIEVQHNSISTSAKRAIR